jgi:hypothetical protein
MDKEVDKLIEKLEITHNNKAYTLHAPDCYLQEISQPITIEEIMQFSDAISWLQVFYKNEQALRRDMVLLKSKISRTGKLWVCWPKKTSKMPSNLTDSIVRQSGLDSGLVDVKIVSINETWSGLKFVYRVSDRKV